MSAAATPEADRTLLQLVSMVPLSIADVISCMQAIDAQLPNNDGLKWFNRLYLMVTQNVQSSPPGGAWQSPVWLARLDVVFARLYFNAVKDFVIGQPIPSAWKVLFGQRYRTGVDRIQFALAGMNAHINHDLALALLSTDAQFDIVPGLTSPEHADYESVNALLKSVMPAALNSMATDTLGVLAEDTGKIGQILAFWDICKARDLAWDFANHLQEITGPARSAAIEVQDSFTGAIGQAILAVR